MSELRELHRFNAWANRSLLDGVRQLRAEQLEERQEGMYGTIAGVLAHLAQVEAAYLAMMRSEPFEPSEGRSLEIVAESLRRAADGLVELAESAPLDATFHIPWFERDFTVAQGL